jgi:DNA-binding MarR family transcriptional regulator
MDGAGPIDLMSSPEPIIETCTCVAIRKAARHVTQFYDRHLAPLGITTSQYSVLSRIARHGAIGIHALASELGMDRSTMSRTVTPLERAGLVAVGADPGDRRSRLMRLTPIGETCLAKARLLWRVAQSAFERAYGPDAAGDLNRTLARLSATALPLPG